MAPYAFLKNDFIVVQLQLSAFSSHPSTPPQANPPHALASTLPIGFVHVSFIVVPENPFLHYTLPPPLWLLSDCSYFYISSYILFAFFLLLFMFQLKVRSYDICPLLPGLFHLA